MSTDRIGQNLVEISPGRWKVTVNLPASANPDHKRHRRVAYVTGGKRAAEQKRRELLTQRDAGKLKPRTAGTVDEYLHRWLEGKRSKVAPRTAARWQGLINNQVAPYIGETLLRDVRPATLRDLYASLQTEGLSGTTRHKTHALLRLAFGNAVRYQEMSANPCLGVPADDVPSDDTPEARVLDEDGANELLEALAGMPIYTPVLVALDCGLRRSELLALHWADVDLGERSLVVRAAVEEDGKTLRTPKTGRARVVRLTGRATAALEAHRRRQAELRLALANRWVDRGLVFPQESDRRSPAGRIWRPGSFSRAFREASRGAGFVIGLHTLRHTHATTMLRAGVDPRVVADRLGHATTRQTQDTYQHVLADHQREAVEAYENRMLRKRDGPESLPNRQDSPASH